MSGQSIFSAEPYSGPHGVGARREEPQTGGASDFRAMRAHAAPVGTALKGWDEALTARPGPYVPGALRDSAQTTAPLPWIDVFLESGSGEIPEAASAEQVEILPTVALEDDTVLDDKAGKRWYDNAVAADASADEGTWDTASDESVEVGFTDPPGFTEEHAAATLEAIAERVRRRGIRLDNLSPGANEASVLAAVLSALLSAG